MSNAPQLYSEPLLGHFQRALPPYQDTRMVRELETTIVPNAMSIIESETESLYQRVLDQLPRQASRSTINGIGYLGLPELRGLDCILNQFGYTDRIDRLVQHGRFANTMMEGFTQNQMALQMGGLLFFKPVSELYFDFMVGANFYGSGSRHVGSIFGEYFALHRYIENPESVELEWNDRISTQQISTKGVGFLHGKRSSKRYGTYTEPSIALDYYEKDSKRGHEIQRVNGEMGYHYPNYKKRKERQADRYRVWLRDDKERTLSYDFLCGIDRFHIRKIKKSMGRHAARRANVNVYYAWNQEHPAMSFPIHRADVEDLGAQFKHDFFIAQTKDALKAKHSLSKKIKRILKKYLNPRSEEPYFRNDDVVTMILLIRDFFERFSSETLYRFTIPLFDLFLERWDALGGHDTDPSENRMLNTKLKMMSEAILSAFKTDAPINPNDTMNLVYALVRETRPFFDFTSQMLAFERFGIFYPLHLRHESTLQIDS